jgi:hypothetical protein
LATPAKSEFQPTTGKEAEDAQRKAGLLQAVTQLDMLLQCFGDAPEKVKKTATEFKEALKEWANA